MKIAMERCPKCERENYAMNVIVGVCTWCGYKAKKSDIGKRGIWEVKK